MFGFDNPLNSCIPYCIQTVDQMNPRTKKIVVGAVMAITVISAGGSLVVGAYIGSKILMIHSVALYALALIEFGSYYFFSTYNGSSFPPIQQSNFQREPWHHEIDQKEDWTWNPETDRKEFVERRPDHPNRQYNDEFEWGHQMDIGLNPFDNNSMAISVLFGISVGLIVFGLSSFFGLGIYVSVVCAWAGTAMGLVATDYMFNFQIPNRQVHRFEYEVPPNTVKLPLQESSAISNGLTIPQLETRDTEEEIKVKFSEQQTQVSSEPSSPRSVDITISAAEFVRSLNDLDINSQEAPESKLSNLFGLIKKQNRSNSKNTVDLWLDAAQVLRRDLLKEIEPLNESPRRSYCVGLLKDLNFAIIHKLWKPFCFNQYEKTFTWSYQKEGEVKEAAEDRVVLQPNGHKTTFNEITALQIADGHIGLSGYDALFTFARHCSKKSISGEEAYSSFKSVLPSWLEKIWVDRAYHYMNNCQDITSPPNLNVDNLNANELRFLIRTEPFFNSVNKNAHFIVFHDAIEREYPAYRYLDSGLPVLMCIDNVWNYFYCTKIDPVVIEREKKEPSPSGIVIREEVLQTVNIKFARKLRNHSSLLNESLFTKLDSLTMERIPLPPPPQFFSPFAPAL